MLKIYSAEGCPFAHRIRALLTHLRIPHEVSDIDLEDRDPAFLELTPTGRVPLLVDGDFVLYESDVINTYLAEAHALDLAFASDERLRARQRLAMKQWDATVVPAFYRSLRDPASLDASRCGEVERELDQLAETIAQPASEVESVLGFHLATHWVRMVWLRDLTSFVEMVESRPALREWLDGAAAMPAVQETLPDREATIRRYAERHVGLRATTAIYGRAESLRT